MTREEAIEFIAQSVKSDVDMAKVADAIEALEQEPVLDKIRAEIEQIIREEIVDRAGGEYETIVSTIDPDDVLEIIDKYKSESEK